MLKYIDKGLEKLRAATGKLEKRQLERKAARLCPDRLKAYISENPDSYQSEIAEVFQCTQAAVSYALKRATYCRKSKR